MVIPLAVNVPGGDLAGEQIFLGQGDGLLVVVKGRITSYNVCYTKLLRESGLRTS